jgi:hypothetical protein
VHCSRGAPQGLRLTKLVRRSSREDGYRGALSAYTSARSSMACPQPVRVECRRDEKAGENSVAGESMLARVISGPPRPLERAAIHRRRVCLGSFRMLDVEPLLGTEASQRSGTSRAPPYLTSVP